MTVWVLAAAILTTIVRNPIYTTLILLSALTLSVVFAKESDSGGFVTWRIGLLFIVISSGYNALFIHAGKTVLFTIPNWPLIGGPVTLEAIVDGARNGLVLFTLLAIFAVLNKVIPTSSLLRLIPSAFHDLGVVAVLAITYLPETQRQLGRIKEAQALRGHKLKGLRDWRAIAIPLLVGSLERAMRLAEAMVSRGYGNTKNQVAPTGQRLALVAGMLVALAGLLLLIWMGWPGWLLLLLGVAIVGAIVWQRGRSFQRTRYEPRSWNRVDTLMLVTVGLNLMLIIPTWHFVDRSTIAYSTYPEIGKLGFDPLLVLVLTSMLLPAFAPSVQGWLRPRSQ